MSDNLSIPQVAASQNQKEVVINAATVQLSGALADFLSCDASTADYTVTLSNFQQYMGFNVTGNAVARNFNVPAQKRALFVVYNGGSVTLSVVRGTTTANVAPGGYGMFQTDGTTNGMSRVLGLSSLQQNIAFSIAGAPPPSMNVVCPINQALKLPTGLTGSHFGCITNPTSTWTFTLKQKSGSTTTTIGTVSFDNTGAPTVSFTADITFAVGDFLILTAPATQDATGADVGFTFLASLI